MFFKKKKRNLVGDLELASKWVAKALNSSNYQADYSVESLKEIDRFFKEENKPGDTYLLSFTLEYKRSNQSQRKTEGTPGENKRRSIRKRHLRYRSYEMGDT